MESLEAAASQQPFDFWRYVCGRSKASKEHISLLNSDEEKVEDVAASFARYFPSIFQLPDANDRCLPFNNLSNFNTIMFDEKRVNDSLKQMKPSFSCGADGIPAALMKAYGNIFMPVLTSIYNNCLLFGTFPYMFYVPFLLTLPMLNGLAHPKQHFKCLSAR